MKKNMIILGLLIILITAQPLGTQIIKPPKKEALSHKDATIKQLKENRNSPRKLLGLDTVGKERIGYASTILL